MELIEERVQNFKKQFFIGEISPIPYYMELNRMDLNVLSSFMGKWKWLINRHFKPSVFKKLSSKTLNKYAKTFNISVEELKNIKN